MSEVTQPKRAALTSIEVQKVSKKSGVRKSFRFNLTLTESNEKSCPMFNFKDLLDSAEATQKNEENNRATNGLDPFGEDDDQAEVQRLAKQFEAKYGCATPRRKKKKYKGDWADMGAGYDENDSFIDNTDAYDEIVPEDISPEHGGFYINSGSLEFKQQDLCEMEDLPRISGAASSKNRKRVIEDDDSDNEPENNRIMAPPAEKKPKIEPKKLENGIKKNKPVIPPIPKKAVTVKELLKEKRDDVESEATIKEAIESVISGTIRVDESSKDSTSSQSSATSSSAYGDSSDEETKSEQPPPIVEPKPPVPEIPPVPELVPLPPNIPEPVIALIDAFKQGGRPEGKGKFNDSNNKALLMLNQLCRTLKSSMKSQIYEHLAGFVKCTKDTLYRRSKKLALEHEHSLLDVAVSNLKEAVDRIMPIVIESYSQECQRINEKKLIHDRESPNGEKPKFTRLPKRKFHWTDTSRKPLGEIVVRKRAMYRQEKNHKEKFDQYLENFYRNKLISIWPEGWMSSANLIRESLQFFTKEERPMKIEKRPDHQPQMKPNNIPIKPDDKPKPTKLPTIDSGSFLTNKPGLSIEPVLKNSSPIPPPSQKSKETTPHLSLRNITELLPPPSSDPQPPPPSTNNNTEKDSDIEIIDLDEAPPRPKKSKEARKKKKEATAAADLIQKLIGNSVSITRKSPLDEEISDVVQVMKDLKSLKELSQPILSEPVSVIAVNHRGGAATTVNNNCATGTTAVPVAKNNTNLAIVPQTSITKVSPSNGPSNTAQNSTNSSSAALKKDVMLFPNFLYEYHLSKKASTGTANSPPL